MILNHLSEIGHKSSQFQSSDAAAYLFDLSALPQISPRLVSPHFRRRRRIRLRSKCASPEDPGRLPVSKPIGVELPCNGPRAAEKTAGHLRFLWADAATSPTAHAQHRRHERRAQTWSTRRAASAGSLPVARSSWWPLALGRHKVVTTCVLRQRSRSCHSRSSLRCIRRLTRHHHKGLLSSK